MPNYTAVNQRITSYSNAAALLPSLRQIFQQCQQVDDLITLYQANTNPDFNLAIESIFDAGERQQLGQMLTNVQQLVALWETNHSALLAETEP